METIKSFDIAKILTLHIIQCLPLNFDETKRQELVNTSKSEYRNLYIIVWQSELFYKYNGIITPHSPVPYIVKLRLERTLEGIVEKYGK